MDSDEVPIYKGDKGIVEACRDIGLRDGAVTVRAAHVAVYRREIIPTRIGNANWYSRSAVEEWLRSRRQFGVYRVAKAAGE